MSAPLPDAATLHYRETARRKQAGRRILWGLIGLFVGLLIAIPGGMYLAWLMQGKRELRREVEALVAAREPITTEEMAALYQRLPAGRKDLTSLWVGALAPFDGWSQELGGLPDYDPSVYRFTLLGQPPHNLAAMEALLAEHQAKIDGLHAAAEQTGVVRYPHDFDTGPLETMREIDQMNGATNALLLEFQVLARRGDLDGVQRNLQTRIRMAETLAESPFLVSLRCRARFHQQAMSDMRHLANQRPLPAAYLHELQQLIRPLDYQGQLRWTLRGERVYWYLCGHYRFATENDLVKAADGNPLETTHDSGEVYRPEDCARGLRMLTRMIEACEASPRVPLGTVDALRSECEAITSSDSSLERWRYRNTTLVVPLVVDVMERTAEAEMMRDLTDLALAAHRYRAEQGALPEKIELLAPEFLPQVPNDIFSGGPIVQKIENGTLFLYSVGADRTDDGGRVEEATGPRPDIVVSLPVK